ncbi:DNA-binding transcriptional LysR family regulator [Catenibacillus scindens]|uniref:DNA-binding transcriptional LysR family regulator n=1 Tax=Catenibacillus scindens TaxID=673271 RepID=A0A7W8HCU0_9FIRM|nr:LysR family transcriptional regulator [Catenibacillus scindens]MBB5265317.1 DNA-binding transcriptional LysR family regulator [Catenibacillus scindens]
MNTKTLTEFQAVYENQSIHKAARQLFITPQGLGKNIRQLEEELHTQLFERTKQGVLPTASGRLLYKKSADILRQLRQVDHEIQQLKFQDSRLRIGCAYGVFNMLPMQKLLDFIQNHPKIAVEYYEYSNEEIRRQILDARLDYGIIVGRSDERDFLEKKLAACPVVVLVYEGHPLYDAGEVPIARLEGEKLLSMNEAFWICQEMIRRCREAGFEPEIIAKSVDGIVLQKLCSQKIGLAIVPEVVVGELNMTNLRAIPLKERFFWEIYGICCHDAKAYMSVRLFDEAL